MSQPKRRVWRWLCITIVGGIAVTTALLAGCSHFKTPEERAQALVKHAAWELDLNTAQQADLQHVADAMLTLRQALRGVEDTQYQALHQLMTADAFDSQQALALYSTARQELDQGVPQVISAYAQFHAGLSAEQRQELAERLNWLHDSHTP